MASFPFESFDGLVDLLSLDLDSKSLTSSLKRIGMTVIGFGAVVVIKTPVPHRCRVRVEGISRDFFLS